MKDLKVIDFEKDSERENCFTLTYGCKDNTDYWGDDWDSTPYEHNAGPVYSVNNEMNVHYNLDGVKIFEPCDCSNDSPWSKNDFKERLCPCLIIVPDDVLESYGLTIKGYESLFNLYMNNYNTVKIYFEDSYEEVEDKIQQFLQNENDDELVEKIIDFIKTQDTNPHEIIQYLTIESTGLLQKYFMAQQSYNQKKENKENLKNLFNESLANILIYSIYLADKRGFDYKELITETLKDYKKLQSVNESLESIQDNLKTMLNKCKTLNKVTNDE